MMKRKCRNCGETIGFAVNTATGRSLPLDLEAPVYEIDETGNAVRRTGCYVLHFSACPAAKRFSRRATKGARG